MSATDKGGSKKPPAAPPAKRPVAPPKRPTIPVYTPKPGTPPKPGPQRPGPAKPAKPPTAKDPMLAEYEKQKAADAAERAADKRKSSDVFLKNASALQGQIDALKKSINSGFGAALNQRLRNIQMNETQGVGALKEGYATRVKSLDEAEANNTRAAGSSSQENLSNRNRERTQLLAEALTQGAGESDVLRAQQVSLRNWDQNQAEVQRSFYDTLSSVNSGLRDLNVDTKTGFANVVSSAGGDRDSVWTTFYNQQSEALTQLGNLHGQQGEYYGAANAAVTNQGIQNKQTVANREATAMFNRASVQNAKVWEDPGQPAWLKEWKGQADYASDLQTRSFDQANQKVQRIKAPQGATLRKWDA